MLSSLIEFFRQRLESFFQMEEEAAAPRHRRWLLRGGKLLYLVVRKGRRDLLLERSASLSFTSTVSMIPLGILLFMIFNSMGYVDEALKDIKEFVVKLVAHEPDQKTNNEATEENRQEELHAKLNAIVAELRGPLETQGRKIGPIAILFLLIATFSLYTSAERAFSVIWHAEAAPGYFHKIGTLWLLLTGAPAILGTAISLTTKGGFLVAWVLPILISFFAFALLFVYLPNTRVRLDAASVGAIISAIVWQLGTWSLILYVKTVFALGLYNNLGAVYWMIGALPLFFFWIYFCWVVALAGGEITYCLQNYKAMEREVRFHISEQHVSRPVLALLFLECIYRGYQGEQKLATSDSLAVEFCIPHEVAEEILDVLQDAGVVVNEGGKGVTPRQAAHQIHPLQVMEVFPAGSGYTLPEGLGAHGTPLTRLLRGIEGRVRAELEGRNLAQLMEEKSEPAKAR